jgi:hypothetical protein
MKQQTTMSSSKNIEPAAYPCLKESQLAIDEPAKTMSLVVSPSK